MQDNLVESIDYKGHVIDLYYDFNADSPDCWGDEGLFLVGYHRDFTVTRNSIADREDVIEAMGDLKHPLRKKYHLFGLEAYIHGAVRLALAGKGNFPDRQWDVSYLGAVFVSKEEWSDLKDARKAAEGLIENWNDYLTGDVYGYETSVDDSCWGFYGDDGKEQAIQEAKAAIDYHINKKLKRHQHYLKRVIRSKVPVQYRKAFTYV